MILESFRPSDTLPVAPGASPFHVKGIYYLRVLERAKSLFGGVDRFLAELADARVREFLRQRFEFNAWYDALPALPCGMTFARIQGHSLEAFAREAGRQTMLRLSPSMFRLLSRVGGPRIAAAHAPRLFRSYFDFMDVTVPHVTDDAAVFTASGIPLYAAPAIVNMALGLAAGGLESLGATDVEMSYRDVTVDGASGGFDTVSCHGEFRWHLGGRAG